MVDQRVLHLVEELNVLELDRDLTAAVLVYDVLV